MADENIPKIDTEDIQTLNKMLDELRSKYGLYQEHPRQSDFHKLCLFRGRFHTTEVIKVLSDDEPMDTPFKWVLAAGLCGWVIDPTNNYISENLMYLEVERILDEYVAYASETELNQLALEEIFGKFILSGRDFHKDVVFPLKGPSPYEYYSSSIDLENQIQTEIRSFNSINYCLLVLQWMGKMREPKQRYAPSWNSVRQFAAIQKELSVKQNQMSPYEPVLHLKSEYSETRLREGWAQYMRSLSMLYTANYVKITRNRTLLEMIVSTELNTRSLLKVLPEWLEKSAYFYANDLKPLKNTAQSDVGEWLIKYVPQRAFSPIKVNQQDKKYIDEILKDGIKSTLKKMNK